MNFYILKTILSVNVNAILHVFTICIKKKKKERFEFNIFLLLHLKNKKSSTVLLKLSHTTKNKSSMSKYQLCYYMK